MMVHNRGDRRAGLREGLQRLDMGGETNVLQRGQREQLLARQFSDERARKLAAAVKIRRNRLKELIGERHRARLDTLQSLI